MSTWNYSPRYSNSHALIIGINKYQHVNPLGVARADAESVAVTLIKELDFPEANVTLLLDDQATKTTILRRFLAFESVATDDRLFVFFAGHGATVSGQRGAIGYLIPVDGRTDDRSTLIRWDELTRNAEIIPAKHILFVMDACYSGLAIQRATGIGDKRFVSNMLQRLSRQVITAGKADETVADGGGPTGNNSIFTGYLLEGLKGKAATESGVLTASHLMNYVYQKVGTDNRSHQTPAFGHIDGDGDFVLRTPNGQHLGGGVGEDLLVNPVVERPEPSSQVLIPTIKPVFAERNGYSDPDSVSFGQNEWTRRLHWLELKPDEGNPQPEQWMGKLALVIEPVSNEPLNLDLADLAQTLHNSKPQGTGPFATFAIPTQVLTTAKSVIFYESDYSVQEKTEDHWMRFLRMERSGAIEYCDRRIARILGQGRGIKVFRYVPLIGLIWSFIYLAKRILHYADYQFGVRYLVNLVATQDTFLGQFSTAPGKDGHHWLDLFDVQVAHRADNWKCRDAHLQMVFQFAIQSLGESEAKKIILQCAEQLGLAYNHQSKPRCFNCGTEDFPWEQAGL